MGDGDDDDDDDDDDNDDADTCRTSEICQSGYQHHNHKHLDG